MALQSGSSLRALQYECRHGRQTTPSPAFALRCDPPNLNLTTPAAMKLNTILTLALTASAVNAVALQARHYLFPALTGTADWSSVRTTANHYSNGPVTDVTSSAIRCYELAPGSGAATTQNVAAGGSVSFKITPNIFRWFPPLSRRAVS